MTSIYTYEMFQEKFMLKVWEYQIYFKSAKKFAQKMFCLHLNLYQVNRDHDRKLKRVLFLSSVATAGMQEYTFVC